ncbi:MAG: agmatine deiminase family protein [Muribaculaceae bacterium]
MENKLRLPAEWEPQSAVLIAWPHEHTDWNYMLDEVTECYKNIANAILADEHLIVASLIDPIKLIDSIDSPHKWRLMPYQIVTNDTWARDFGPITMLDGEGRPVLLDFVFNAWGMKFAANYDNLITQMLELYGAFECPVEGHLEFVLEGGSIESDGKGCILTTEECMTSINRNGHMTFEQVDAYLKKTFNARKIVWLYHGALEGDDTDGHIDTLARFAPDDTILYVGCDDAGDSHYKKLKKMEQELREATNADGKPFRLIKLPFPDAIYDEYGFRLPATYANFLITNKSVLVPTYAQPENDLKALELIAEAFPGRRVVGIDCRALIKQHGSLHCVTMQLPKGVIEE